MSSRVIEWTAAIALAAWAVARLVVREDAFDWLRERVEHRFPTTLLLRSEVAPGDVRWRPASIRDMRRLHRAARFGATSRPRANHRVDYEWAVDALPTGSDIGPFYPRLWWLGQIITCVPCFSAWVCAAVTAGFAAGGSVPLPGLVGVSAWGVALLVEAIATRP